MILMRGLLAEPIAAHRDQRATMQTDLFQTGGSNDVFQQASHPPFGGAYWLGAWINTYHPIKNRIAM
jgi:hypothetical protein